MPGSAIIFERRVDEAAGPLIGLRLLDCRLRDELSPSGPSPIG